jgi:hypothetical protein
MTYLQSLFIEFLFYLFFPGINFWTNLN